MENEDVEVVLEGVRVRLRADDLAIMALVSRGLTYREVGCRLGLSRHGVRKRVWSMCNRLGVNNRVEALVLLLREGVL